MGVTVPGPAFLHGDLEVTRLLLRRRAEGSVPGARRDGHRLALVVGGGGMRGSYTAGMLRGLERAGLRAGFDEVYGASSGAFSGAAFLTGGAEAGAACYPEDLASRTFIDLRRLGTRRPVLSLDFLVTEVLGRQTAALGSPVRCDGPAVGGGHRRRRPHRAHPESDDRRAVGPGGVGQGVHPAAGRAAGGVRRSALGGRLGRRAAGRGPGAARWRHPRAGHAVPGHRGAAPGRGRRAVLVGRTMDRLVPGLGTLAQGSRRYRRDLDVVTDAAHPDRGPAHLAAIAPARSAGVGGLCTDRDALARAVDTGDASTAAAVEYADSLDPSA
jgi:hypothetical protein